MTVTAPSGGGGDVLFLLLDEEAVDNGGAPNNFSATDVNDQKAKLAQRAELAYFDRHPNEMITLYSGQVGDEGWFAPKTIPPAWDRTGPTPNGLRNFVGNPSQPYPHNVGPRLGTADHNGDRESLLDKIRNVTPLRASGLDMLEDRTVCAVVFDSNIGINYSPLNGSLKGENLGTVAMRVLDVTKRTGGSSGSLPKVRVEILDAENVCEQPLRLFTEAPVPSSSSEPYDTDPDR